MFSLLVPHRTNIFINILLGSDFGANDQAYCEAALTFYFNSSLNQVENDYLFYFLMIGGIILNVWVTLVNCPTLVLLLWIFVFVFHNKVRNMKETKQGN